MKRTSLRLFAFDDEDIAWCHAGLIAIEEITRSRIWVRREAGPARGEPPPECEILVDCTYAAPGELAEEAQAAGDDLVPIGVPGRVRRTTACAQTCLREQNYDVILLDNTVRDGRDPQHDYGVDKLLPLAYERSPDATIAIVTGFPVETPERAPAIDRAVQTAGANFLWLPKEGRVLRETLYSILLLTAQLKREREGNQSLSAENRSLRDQLRVESELVGNSGAIKELEKQIGRVAGTKATCLIRGESGVGKELVARAIHYSSLRKDGPFVCLNCAALTETLLESELFGHEKGSFTGATEKKIGKFEAANHGTIFLDEIGEMTVGTQAKLLRILEGHPFERVGGSVPIRVDVRVVAATNQPLEQAIHDGQFRRDLFFRLQVVEIQVPSLRDRKSDIPILADHFLRRFVRETARKIRGFTASALRKMEDYDWPGNVRELKNMVERAVALGGGADAGRQRRVAVPARGEAGGSYAGGNPGGSAKAAVPSHRLAPRRGLRHAARTVQADS